MGHGASAPSIAPAGRPLPLPPLIEPDASGVVKLKVQTGRHSFEEGSEAASAGINGAYLGPLVRLTKGKRSLFPSKIVWMKGPRFIGMGFSFRPYSTADLTM